MKMRFTLALTDMAASGFHGVVSFQQANKILAYLKAGNGKSIPENQTWALAQKILAFSSDKAASKDQRKRHMLQCSIKGLVGELAFVFKITLKEMAERIRISLGKISKINPVVLAALSNASED